MGNTIQYIYKSLAGILILVSLNYLYKFTSFEHDIQKYSEFVNLGRQAVRDSIEIIYVGESSNNTFRKDDEDKRAISEMLSDFYPKIKIGTITKEASHAAIFYELLRNIPEPSTIKTVIVTLNLRSFDANWIFSNLETPLQKSIVLLKDHPALYNRFLLTFKGYDVKTDKEREKQFKFKWKHDPLNFQEAFQYKNTLEWDNGIAQKGIINNDGSINSPMTELACHYVKTYAFSIDSSTNPRIKDFDKIVLLAKERNWNLVFNLMAENIEKADSLVGKELTYLIKQNRDLLVERYQSKNVIVVDNLESVSNSEFIDQTWTTEHYAERGRKIIARNVANALKIIYPDKFVQIQLKPFKFSNNCEGITQWGQMQTLTSRKHHSGTKSSKCGQGA
ncbi:MAG: DUF4843 domain-containing protein, partial [Saprospiraceae bacterium]